MPNPLISIPDLFYYMSPSWESAQGNDMDILPLLSIFQYGGIGWQIPIFLLNFFPSFSFLDFLLSKAKSSLRKGDIKLKTGLFVYPELILSSHGGLLADAFVFTKALKASLVLGSSAANGSLSPLKCNIGY